MEMTLCTNDMCWHTFEEPLIGHTRRKATPFLVEIVDTIAGRVVEPPNDTTKSCSPSPAIPHARVDIG